MLHAAAALGEAPGSIIYVGDARRDIEAGQAAGMRTLAAAFGYLGADEDPLSWNADGVIEQPAEVLSWLALPH